MKQIDLHVHSTCSDGTDSPAVLVDKAVDKGLAAFASILSSISAFILIDLLCTFFIASVCSNADI